jgi:serine/threonine-protein kinase RsbW
MKKSIDICNKLEEIDKIAAFIDEIGAELNLDASTINNINLAIEEAVVNVIMYAYPKTDENVISLSVEVMKDELIFILTDKGVAFDPTQAIEADITKSVEDRPIGGLGIFLIRKIMGEVTYQRINGENQLKMKKKI